MIARRAEKRSSHYFWLLSHLSLSTKGVGRAARSLGLVPSSSHALTRGESNGVQATFVS